MDRGWRYRLVSSLGTVVLTALTVVVSNHPAVQAAFGRVPYFGRPAPEMLPIAELSFAVMTTVLVVGAVAWPLFKPSPRRLLDTVLLTQKRILFAMIGLAALGYFDYSYRLPRTTLMLTTAGLLVSLPLFMVTIRRRPTDSSRAIIVGDDPETMAALLSATDLSVVGYVSPPSVYAPEGIEPEQASIVDGGRAVDPLDELSWLGGLARLDDVIVEEDIDTALLAFVATDCEEFFEAIETCHDHGVGAFVHSDHADHVLTDNFTGSELLKVDLEPLDLQEYVLKRLFDVAFAGMALLGLSPAIVLIAVAIKLDDGGPIFYGQERTAAFGNTFTVHKFRSMTPDEADSDPAEDEDYRVTRVGRVLRKTHLDEIPQLWAILVGRMSVVGPRAVWTDEEREIEQETAAWRKRWFIKPGLTGLAQINEATSAEAGEKLRYDLMYIRQQSLWFDLKIVVRQLWQVGTDTVGFIFGNGPKADTVPREDHVDGRDTTEEESDTVESVTVDADDTRRD